MFVLFFPFWFDSKVWRRKSNGKHAASKCNMRRGTCSVKCWSLWLEPCFVAKEVKAEELCFEAVFCVSLMVNNLIDFMDDSHAHAEWALPHSWHYFYFALYIVSQPYGLPWMPSTLGSLLLCQKHPSLGISGLCPSFFHYCHLLKLFHIYKCVCVLLCQHMLKMRVLIFIPCTQRICFLSVHF